MTPASTLTASSTVDGAMTALFRVEAPLAGKPPKVILDGAEVPVAAVAVRTEPGQVTRLYLTLEAGGSLEGEGVVHVVEDLDQREAVAAWLGNLDPETLNKAVLDRLGPGSGPPPAEALAVLREWASGA